MDLLFYRCLLILLGIISSTTSGPPSFDGLPACFHDVASDLNDHLTFLMADVEVMSNNRSHDTEDFSEYFDKLDEAERILKSVQQMLVNPNDPRLIGETGFTGSSGARGATGSSGFSGVIGAMGPRGRTGVQGNPGIMGSTGDTGPTG